MTVTFGYLPGAFHVRPVEPARPAFVRDMPQPRAARQAQHTGPVELMAWLDPITPDGHAYATVRRPNGRMMTVDASTICEATDLASLRLRPGIHDAVRGA